MIDKSDANRLPLTDLKIKFQITASKHIAFSFSTFENKITESRD